MSKTIDMASCACPDCNGFGIDKHNQTRDCPICFGSGDLGQAVYQHVSSFIDRGCPYNDPIAQLVAQYLIDASNNR